MRHAIAWLAVLLLAWPAAARAAGVSGSKPILCAVTEALECPYEGECIHETPEGINLPPFIVVDPKAKTLSEYQGDRKSPVQTVFEKGAHIVLQGYEERAWSAAISKETGRLSVTATSPDAGFVVFGICTDL